MTLYRVSYSGSHSGGYDWTNEADGDALTAAGWLVNETGNPSAGASFMSESDNEEEALFDAMSSWYVATRQDPDESGCSCCGPPHRFEAETEKEYHDGYRNADGSYDDDYEPFDYREGVE